MLLISNKIKIGKILYKGNSNKPIEKHYLIKKYFFHANYAKLTMIFATRFITSY